MNSATSSSARALLLWKAEEDYPNDFIVGCCRAHLNLGERKEYQAPSEGRNVDTTLERYHPREVKIDTVTFGRDSQRA